MVRPNGCTTEHGMHMLRDGRTAHELAVGELIRREFPQVAVSLSAEIQPEIREFERASTTVANAYTQPVTAHHLASLTRGLTDLGFAGRFHIMLSSGGLTDEHVAATARSSN